MSSLPSNMNYNNSINIMDVLHKIRNIGIFEKLNSPNKPSWEDFQKNFLFSKQYLTLYKELLHYFKDSININARDLMIMYSFLYYDMDDDPILIDSIKTLADFIHTETLDLTCMTKLYQKLHHFEIIYVPWKQNDKHAVIEKLTHMYWEYEINYVLYENKLSNEEKNFFLNEKNNKQELCLSMMKKIDNLEYFNKFQPVFTDSETSEVLIDILRRAFWDRIIKDIASENPNYESLYSVFREIREHLEIIHRNRPHIIEQYNDIIDIDFFRERHLTNNMDLQFWEERLGFLMKCLIETDSIEKEKQHFEILNNLNNKIIECKNEIETIEVCIECLAYITTRLLEIRQLYEHVFPR